MIIVYHCDQCFAECTLIRDDDKPAPLDKETLPKKCPLGLSKGTYGKCNWVRMEMKK